MRDTKIKNDNDDNARENGETRPDTGIWVYGVVTPRVCANGSSKTTGCVSMLKVGNTFKNI